MHRVVIVAAALVLLIVGGVLAQSASRPAAAPIVGGAPNGHFQIVNGTPELVQDATLRIRPRG